MTFDPPVIRCERRGSVLEVRLVDGDRNNALSVRMVVELRAVLTDLQSAAAVVLTGSGRHFCAGGDHDEIAHMSEAQMRVYRADLGAVFAALDDCPVPIVAAVRGGAIGGGAELAMRADFVVAERSAVFAFPQVALGIGVSGAALRVLVARGGLAFARRMVLRGQRVTAEQALEHGLIDELADGLDEAALALATELAALPAPALLRARVALRRVIADPIRVPSIVDR